MQHKHFETHHGRLYKHCEYRKFEINASTEFLVTFFLLYFHQIEQTNLLQPSNIVKYLNGVIQIHYHLMQIRDFIIFYNNNINIICLLTLFILCNLYMSSRSMTYCFSCFTTVYLTWNNQISNNYVSN